MANDERLLQILSKIQALSDLTNRMKDTDIYPVSFFSNVYDCIQTIQSEFQLLEADQVNQFVEQMNKHHDLILSIHKQMRYMDEEEEPEVIVVEPMIETITPPDDIIQPLLPPPIPMEMLAEEQPPMPEKIQQIPVVSKKEMLKRSTITIPEPISERILSPSGRGVKPLPPPLPVERSAPPSLNDAIEKNKLSDLRKAFSLNDRYRYRRELFNGSEDLMNEAVITLNNKESLQESLQFLEETTPWDFNNPTVKDFIKILELRFN